MPETWQFSSEAASVWNRACEPYFRPQREGDRALKAVLRFDGLTANGGLGHSLDVLPPAAVRDAIEGFRYFGLVESAELVETALALPDEAKREALTDSYYQTAELRLPAAFESHYATHRDKYEPLE
jgi:hypothetical protein